MSRIVFAWELGDNFGHLYRMLPIAEALLARGHQVSFIVNHLTAAQAILAPRGIPFLPAPALRAPHELNRDIASYADILARTGFTQATALHGMMTAWRHLHGLLQTDVVVLEHAPAALIAARMLGLKTVHIGTGFTIPPAVAPMPCFRPWRPDLAAALATTECKVLATINTVLATHGHAAAASLSDALQTDRTILLTLPELDHYPGAKRSHAVLASPLQHHAEGQTVHWQQTRLPRIFMYLRQHPWLPEVLDLLAATNVEVIAMIPDISEPLLQRHAGSRRLRIYRQPLNLQALLPTCELAITHGGHGTTADCLQHGVPMLLLPGHIEQLLITARVAAAGAGQGILPDAVENAFGQVLQTLLTDAAFTLAAHQIACRHAKADPAQTLATLVETIESLATAAATSG